MTNEQILELAKTCEFDYHKKWRHKGGKSGNQIHWDCWEDQLLKFALAIHENGYNEGYEFIIGKGYETRHTYTEYTLCCKNCGEIKSVRVGLVE